MRCLFLACILLVFTGSTILSQGPLSNVVEHPRCQVYGRVIAPAPLLETGLKIELAGAKPIRRQVTNVVNGAFEFQAVPPGVYRFRVFDVSGKEILRGAEQLSGQGDEVIVRVPLREQEPSVANMISLRQLGRKIEANALKAFRAAEKAAASGEILKSIELFQNAARLDGHFAEAEGNLAVQQMLLGHEDEALLHAQAAYDLDSEVPAVGHTLAALLIHAKQYCEAETVLRRMLKSQHAPAELTGWLAVSLIGQSRIEEGFAYLKQAANEFPMVRLLAANTLVETGAVMLAVNQVREYMRSYASECERRRLERWIEGITHSGPSVAGN